MGRISPLCSRQICNLPFNLRLASRRGELDYYSNFSQDTSNLNNRSWKKRYVTRETFPSFREESNRPRLEKRFLRNFSEQSGETAIYLEIRTIAREMMMMMMIQQEHRSELPTNGLGWARENINASELRFKSRVRKSDSVNKVLKSSNASLGKSKPASLFCSKLDIPTVMTPVLCLFPFDVAAASSQRFRVCDRSGSALQLLSSRNSQSVCLENSQEVKTQQACPIIRKIREIWRPFLFRTQETINDVDRRKRYFLFYERVPHTRDKESQLRTYCSTGIGCED